MSEELNRQQLEDAAPEIQQDLPLTCVKTGEYLKKQATGRQLFKELHIEDQMLSRSKVHQWIMTEGAKIGGKACGRRAIRELGTAPSFTTSDVPPKLIERQAVG